MSTMTNPFKWLIENWGKEPEPRPPIIPGPWRIPFYIGLSVVSLAVLALLVYYVIMPGMRAEQPSRPAPASAPAP